MLRYFLTEMMLPPAINILLLVAAAVLWRLRRRIAMGLLALGAGSLLLLAMPSVKVLLYQGLERYAPVDLTASMTQESPPRAIVVLSGGLIKDAPEYGRSVAGSSSIKRILYAAELHHQSGLPVLLTGGVPGDAEMSEAEAMAHILARFNIWPRWLERASQNTWENAQFSARLLQQSNIQKVVLVTEAWHMPRAVYSFQRHGIDVIAASTGYRSVPVDWSYGLIPNAGTLAQSAEAVREYLGMVVYRLGQSE